MKEQQSARCLKCEGFSARDIERFVEIHEAEIQDGFLTSLGREALRLLYSEMAESQHCILVAGIQGEDTEPAGFIAGAADCLAFYRDFFKHKGLSALRVFLPRLVSWTRLRKAVETLLYPTRKRHRISRSAEILNFAVLSRCHGTGLAQSLFWELMRRFRALGVKEVRIVTGEAQGRAQRFYEKAGAKLVGATSVHKGQNDLVFLFELK